LVDWDDRDRLVAITSSDGRRVDFAYDALNRRVKKTAAGVETVFVWDGEVLLHDAFSLTENAIFFGARSLRID
jgi:YD repeat-containing protein